MYVMLGRRESLGLKRDGVGVRQLPEQILTCHPLLSVFLAIDLHNHEKKLGAVSWRVKLGL